VALEDDSHSRAPFLKRSNSCPWPQAAPRCIPRPFCPHRDYEYSHKVSFWILSSRQQEDSEGEDT
jgi:hypothetical protein